MIGETVVKPYQS